VDLSILILPLLLIFIFIVDGFKSSIRWLLFATVLVSVLSILYYIVLKYYACDGKKVFAIAIIVLAILLEYYKKKKVRTKDEEKDTKL